MKTVEYFVIILIYTKKTYNSNIILLAGVVSGFASSSPPCQPCLHQPSSRHASPLHASPRHASPHRASPHDATTDSTTTVATCRAVYRSPHPEPQSDSQPPAPRSDPYLPVQHQPRRPGKPGSGATKKAGILQGVSPARIWWAESRREGEGPRVPAVPVSTPTTTPQQQCSYCHTGEVFMLSAFCVSLWKKSRYIGITLAVCLSVCHICHKNLMLLLNLGISLYFFIKLSNYIAYYNTDMIMPNYVG